MLLAPIASADAHDDKGDGCGGGGGGGVRASPMCGDSVGHATTMRGMRRGAAFEAPTPLTCCLRLTNSKMPTARRSRPMRAPCATAVGWCVRRVEVAAVAARVGCSLGIAERGEQNVEQAEAHKEHAGPPPLQGGRCVTLQTAPHGRRANLVCCVRVAMVPEARAGLACASVHDPAHGAEA